jgi:hypothetical protein
MRTWSLRKCIPPLRNEFVRVQRLLPGVDVQRGDHVSSIIVWVSKSEHRYRIGAAEYQTGHDESRMTLWERSEGGR